MITFLPDQSFVKCAEFLDNKRLGQQRNEALAIIKILAGEKSRWENHPIIKMWYGQEYYLKFYYNSILLEWSARGFKNIIHKPFESILGKPDNYPIWWNDERLYSSHRSNLIRKLPEWYSKFWPNEPNNLPYFWPH